MCAHNIAQSHSRAQCPPIPISDGFSLSGTVFFCTLDRRHLAIGDLNGVLWTDFTHIYLICCTTFFCIICILIYIYIYTCMVLYFYLSIYLSIYLSVGININVCNLFLASADVGSISKQIRVTTIQPVSDASLLRSETNATQTGAACACAGL